MLVNSADLQRQTASTGAQLPYDFLEQFHVFVLANILQRPVIIVGEPYLRSLTGDYIEPNDFVGVYLPLLWRPYMCLPAPIVLAFLMDHFLPLSSCSRGSGDDSSQVWAVPLVTASMEPLRVHFLLPSEENRAYMLLQLYLDLIELQATGDDGCDEVLAAKIVLDDHMHRPLTVRDVIFQSDGFLPKCTRKHCEFVCLGRTARRCFACMLSCPPYQSLADDDTLKGSRLPRCANVGCENDSWLPSGGLCRLCSRHCYPRHYDMPANKFMKQLTLWNTQHGMSFHLQFFVYV